ncbi:phosphate/phosphite/phosphonate ABC transporter substrate-binding protein [Marinobacterium sp. D7]|uniref:phosphate/phosphite/phosphonate ABC transporter substrate-binding protein n=1 Tax=Marinobacterium ramblicola TaxID=2849041 RepID=UPI001C2DE637|nr:phosphate/phosphite/phosphonate ABC transporter substrate-binding protein [Marinobacterium ramblicola]MBV1789274.1 phosphate/phosphite/phosphonate ABC transporter substrate-binding protein [Marinobacterium ramblicola]
MSRPRTLFLTQALPNLLLALGVLLLPASLSAQPLVLAQVSERPKKDYAELRPMASYVADRLGEFGFDGVEVKLFRSADELIEAVRAGEVHWVTETPYTTARLVQETGSQALVKKWKNGQRQYQTLIYTRDDSGIRELHDLVGRRFAFEHPYSFSSYYLPKRILERAGLALTPLESSGDTPPDGGVGYLFSRNEKNNALWVDKAIVAAGALNDGDWNNPDRVPPSVRQRLRIIYRSPFYPRAFETVTPALSADAAHRLKQLLLDLDHASHGALMSRYENTEAFAPIEPSDLQLLHDMVVDTGGTTR